MRYVPYCCLQRGNNRQVCFYADEDYLLYLDWLSNYAAKFECQIHAYVLMTNHVHLLATSQQSESVGLMMKALSQRYVQYVNRTYKRTGTLWEGRYRSCPIQAETYLLACQRYIELNPVRANIVSHPAEYRWSSYRINAQGEDVGLINSHALYQSLGDTEENRQTAYRELFRYELDIGIVDEIRRATHSNYALGNEAFAQQVELALGRKATAGRAGRPRKDEG